MSIPLYTLCFLDSIIKLWIFLLCIAVFKDFVVVVWPRSLHLGMFTPSLSPVCCSSAILSDLLRRNTFQYLPVFPPSLCNFCNLFVYLLQTKPTRHYSSLKQISMHFVKTQQQERWKTQIKSYLKEMLPCVHHSY